MLRIPIVRMIVILDVSSLIKNACVTYLFARNFFLAISLINSCERPISATMSIIMEKANANEYCPNDSVPNCLAMYKVITK